MTEFNFNIDQIKEIYNAGIKRGNDEATAYEHGAYVFGNQYDDCVEAVHNIVNANKTWGDPGYVDYTVVEEWFSK